MRSRIIVFVALAAILVGAYGVYDSMVASRDSQPKVAVQEPEVRVSNDSPEYITVWRLNRDTQRGEPLTNDLVKREQLVLTEALDQGLRADVDLDFNPSTLINSDLKAGQLIQPEHLTKESDPGYIDLLVTEGMTLYPLTVSNKNLISDYIRPGGYIDILTVSSPNSNLSASTDKPIRFRGVTASLFLKGVRVLNIGAVEDDQAIKPVADKNEDGFTTLIIEIPPTEVARLALAQRTMHLEVYRSRDYEEPVYADVSNVMDNYFGIEEMRGSNSKEGRRGEL